MQWELFVYPSWSWLINVPFSNGLHSWKIITLTEILLCADLSVLCRAPGRSLTVLFLSFWFAALSVTANQKAAATAAAEDPSGLHGAWRGRVSTEWGEEMTQKLYVYKSLWCQFSSTSSRVSDNVEYRLHAQSYGTHKHIYFRSGSITIERTTWIQFMNNCVCMYVYVCKAS